MNYQKLDAALAMALNNTSNPEERSLLIFIYTEPVLDSATIAFLENLGVEGVISGKDIYTATLSANAISQLSDQPWVHYLQRSQKLHSVDSSRIENLGV